MLKKKQDNLFSKVKLLLFHPSQFFDSVKNEKDEWVSIKWALGAFVIYAVCGLLIAAVVKLLFTLAFQNILSAGPSTSAGTLESINNIYNQLGIKVIVGLLEYFVLILISILIIPLSHWIVKKFGGKNPRYQTVKAIFYPTAGLFLFSWIPLLGGLIGLIWYLYAEYRGLRKLQGLSRGGFVGYFVVALFVSLVVFSIVDILIVIALEASGIYLES